MNKKNKAIKDFNEFFDNLEKFSNGFLELPVYTAHNLTIEKDGIKVTFELTEKLMRELVAKCVYIYGLETVVKSAVESEKENDAD